MPARARSCSGHGLLLQPLGMCQAVQAMPAQRMAYRHLRMVEVMGVALHAQALHHGLRTQVGQRGERDDGLQMQRAEAVLKRRRAPSLARPCPQKGRASRQPISTQGGNGKDAAGVCSPMKPMNSPLARCSAAQKPQPRSSISAWILSAMASLCSRLSSAGKCSMTCGSAFSAAKGCRSPACHWRSIRRGVRRVATGECVVVMVGEGAAAPADRRPHGRGRSGG